MLSRSCEDDCHRELPPLLIEYLPWSVREMIDSGFQCSSCQGSLLGSHYPIFLMNMSWVGVIAQWRQYSLHMLPWVPPPPAAVRMVQNCFWLCIRIFFLKGLGGPDLLIISPARQPILHYDLQSILHFLFVFGLHLAALRGYFWWAQGTMGWNLCWPRARQMPYSCAMALVSKGSLF